MHGAECFEYLRANRFFSSLSESEAQKACRCFSAEIRGYEKGDTIFAAGADRYLFGILLSGRTEFRFRKPSGESVAIRTAGTGDMLAPPSAVCGAEEGHPADCIAAGPAKVLVLSSEKLMSSCGKEDCQIRVKLMRALFESCSGDMEAAALRLCFMTCGTTREKLLAVLSYYSGQMSCDRFRMPVTRQQLADYLCVNRSSLSREMCKLRDEGYIEFSGRRIAILRALPAT